MHIKINKFIYAYKNICAYIFHMLKVKVNGIEYKPSVASPNKKQAKAEAAQICLQSLGLLLS